MKLSDNVELVFVLHVSKTSYVIAKIDDILYNIGFFLVVVL